jgi:hypothetical protein
MELAEEHTDRPGWEEGGKNLNIVNFRSRCGVFRDWVPGILRILGKKREC